MKIFEKLKNLIIPKEERELQIYAVYWQCSKLFSSEEDLISCENLSSIRRSAVSIVYTFSYEGIVQKIQEILKTHGQYCHGGDIKIISYSRNSLSGHIEHMMNNIKMHNDKNDVVESMLTVEKKDERESIITE